MTSSFLFSITLLEELTIQNNPLCLAIAPSLCGKLAIYGCVEICEIKAAYYHKEKPLFQCVSCQLKFSHVKTQLVKGLSNQVGCFNLWYGKVDLCKTDNDVYLIIADFYQKGSFLQ